MSSNLTSMELATSLARRLRDQALQDFNVSQQQLQFEQNQLQQLQSYSDETQARWVTQSRGHATPELMRHYYQFMDKLQQAVVMQTQIVRDAVHRVDMRQAALMQSEATLSGRETLCDQIRAGQRRLAHQREQKLLDEMAAQQYRRQHRPDDHGGEHGL
jgi:flagellar FliJ protein